MKAVGNNCTNVVKFAFLRYSQKWTNGYILNSWSKLDPQNVIFHKNITFFVKLKYD